MAPSRYDGIDILMNNDVVVGRAVPLFLGYVIKWNIGSYDNWVLNTTASADMTPL